MNMWQRKKLTRAQPPQEEPSLQDLRLVGLQEHSQPRNRGSWEIVLRHKNTLTVPAERSCSYSYKLSSILLYTESPTPHNDEVVLIWGNLLRPWKDGSRNDLCRQCNREQERQHAGVSKDSDTGYLTCLPGKWTITIIFWSSSHKYASWHVTRKK